MNNDNSIPRNEEAAVTETGEAASEDRPSLQTDSFDEPTNRQVTYAVIITFLAFTLAIYDYVAFGILLPKISASLGWSTAFSTTVATLVGVTVLLASFTVGPIADHFGRKKGLIITSVGAALSSGLSALTFSAPYLIIIRGLSGFGYSEQVVTSTYMRELLGQRKLRGFIYSIIQGGYTIGVLLSAGAAAVLIPLIGWRGTFLVATFPAVLIALLAVGLVESPTFKHLTLIRALRKGGRVKEARALEKKHSITDQPTHFGYLELFKPYIRRHTIFLSLGYLGNWFGVQTFLVLGTTVLAGSTGTSFTDTLYFLIAGSAVAFVGFLVHGFLGDHFQRRNVVAIGWTLSGVLFTIMLFGPHVFWFTIILYCVGLFFNQGPYSAMFFYLAESFPPAIRGTGTAFVNAMGPIGAILSSALLSAALGAGFSMEVSAALVGGLALFIGGLCVFGGNRIETT